MEFPKIMPKEKYLGMNTNDQEEYIKKKVIEILELNPNNGMTIPDIIDNTYFKSRQTLIKHLERLISSGRAYKIRRRNLTTYYINGRPDHPSRDIKVTTENGSVIKGKILQNEFGKCIYIEYADDNIRGGILINSKDLKDFSNVLIEVTKELK